VTYVGNITAKSGKIILGQGSVVTGGLNGGSVILSENSSVTDVILSAGDVSLAAGAQTKSINTSAGNITVDVSAQVTHKICNSGSGLITSNAATDGRTIQGSAATGNTLCPTEFSSTGEPTPLTLDHKISTRSWRQIFLR
jgi:hypothetical protein